MIADRVVLLPNTHVGRQTVMGSGALGKRDTQYEDGSTWMGNGTCYFGFQFDIILILSL